MAKNQALESLEHAVLPALGRGRRILKRKRSAAGQPQTCHRNRTTGNIHQNMRVGGGGDGGSGGGLEQVGLDAVAIDLRLDRVLVVQLLVADGVLLERALDEL